MALFSRSFRPLQIHENGNRGLRNRNAAGILALILGWAGIHRFYLGQTGLGILYFMLMFVGVSFVLGIIDAVIFFGMSDEDFDAKYNTHRGMVPPIYNRRIQQGYPQPRQRGNSRPSRMPSNMRVPGQSLQNPYKITGLKKYKDFDLEGAIEDFKKGLEIEPKDIALHFNLACAYSLTEQVDLAYQALDRAVALGFNDFAKIKSHDDLAYVRIQDRWEAFQANNYQLQREQVPTPPTSVEEQRNTPPSPPQDDVLLAQLKRLAELRDRGLLSEQEFLLEKRKLSR